MRREKGGEGTASGFVVGEVARVPKWKEGFKPRKKRRPRNLDQ